MSDKWGRRWFKTGALLLLLMGLVHALSLFGAPVPANDTEKQLFQLMADYKFDLMGSSRSMADLLRGFSISFLAAALGFGALDLSLSEERVGLLKRLALINLIWLAVMIAVSLRFFFVLPTTFFLVALLTFGLAWWTLPAQGVS